MKRGRSWIWLAAAAAAAVGLGWWGAGIWLTRRPAPGLSTPGPVKPSRPGTASTSAIDSAIASIWAAGDAVSQMIAAVDKAATLAPEQFSAFLAELERLPSHSAQGLAKRTILRRWTELNPEAAMHWCMGHDPSLVASVAEEWAARDPTMADAIINQLTTSGRLQWQQVGALRETGGGLFRALAATDREAALRLLHHPALEGGLDNIAGAMESLARQDARWLLEKTEGLPVNFSNPARSAVVRVLAEENLANAFAWARAQPDSKSLLWALMAKPRDAPGLVPLLANLSPEETSTLGRHSFALWGNGDPAPVLDALAAHGSQLDEGLRRQYSNSAAAGFLQSPNPGALASRLLAIEGLSSRFDVQNFVSQWAARSPDAARAWVASLPPNSLQEEARHALDSNSNRPDAPADERTLLQRLVSQASQGRVHQDHALLGLDETERRQVMEAGLAGMTANPNRDHGGLDSVAERFPAETARWLSATLTPHTAETLTRVLNTTAAHWAAEDPRAAAAWADTLPAGEIRGMAAANVFEQWRHYDNDAASAWFDTLPAEERTLATPNKKRP
jgi:hypothetical protein